jgi:hypothetical protein
MSSRSSVEAKEVWTDPWSWQLDRIQPPEAMNTGRRSGIGEAATTGLIGMLWTLGTAPEVILKGKDLDLFVNQIIE